MPSIVLWFTTNPLGSYLLKWALEKIWGLISEQGKEEFLHQKVKSHVVSNLDKYEKIIVEANELAKDGLTEDEKNEIRRKKIEVELDLINNRPR